MIIIDEFIASWDLFHWTYIEGWLIALLLALIGVAVVARDQIFIGAAVSQASTVGIALTLYVASLVPVHEHSGPPGTIAGAQADQINDWSASIRIPQPAVRDQAVFLMK